MSGIASPVYGSYNDSSGAKLPSSVAYFAGEVRNNPVDLEDGATLVAVLEAKTASTEIATDTQISGGLWAVATGFEFRDGTNVSPLPCDWEVSDKLVITLEVGADGTMVIKRLES